jgi:O-antigen ligase
MERSPSVLSARAFGAGARRQSLGVALLALLLGALLAVLGPTWGSLLIGGALFLALLLVAAWSRPEAGVAALAFLIPLQVRLNLPGNGSLAVGFVVISGLALVALYREMYPALRSTHFALRDTCYAIRTTQYVSLSLTLLAGAAAASLFAASDLAEAARRGLYLCWFLALFWLVSRLLRDPEALLRVARTTMTVTAIVALLGIGQFALQFVVGPLPLVGFWVHFVTPILEGERVAAFYQDFGTNWILFIGGQPVMRAIGPFSGPPDVAQYLGVSLPLAAALTLQRPRLRARDVALLGLLGLFLMLSFSRQAWVALLLALLAMFAVGWPMERRTAAGRISRRLGFFLAAGGIVLMPVLAVGSVQSEGPLAAVVERVRSIGDPDDESNRQRFETWALALQVAEERPLLGTGLGNYGIAMSERPGAYSHSTYLDILVETGPLGLLGLLILMAWAASEGRRVACGAARPRLQAFGLGAFGSLIALAVIFGFDDAFYFPRAGQAFWLLLGLVAAAARLTSEAQSRVEP